MNPYPYETHTLAFEIAYKYPPNSLTAFSWSIYPLPSLKVRCNPTSIIREKSLYSWYSCKSAPLLLNCLSKNKIVNNWATYETVMSKRFTIYWTTWQPFYDNDFQSIGYLFSCTRYATLLENISLQHIFVSFPRSLLLSEDIITRSSVR